MVPFRLICVYEKGWQIGFANSLFSSTRACVQAVYDTRSCYTVVCPLGYPFKLRQYTLQF
ncbi:4-diphosphocytidyl-2-C-methyl-D-erythritol kinase [Gossypium arboreum]|uniref:4-diphosphocytidyl-2-C-methyl-D-erythritol kinase n=1 Tax=Gossypium arboreum TaxID=29729 RepID=A0A0B0NA41_GOSAR|nr:4-diphosphocytidyl-2-C-methyl-D-erythritol kinase [Gossypium arboreum]